MLGHVGSVISRWRLHDGSLWTFCYEVSCCVCRQSRSRKTYTETSTSEDAQKKFGNAKAISSAAYFGNSDPDVSIVNIDIFLTFSWSCCNCDFGCSISRSHNLQKYSNTFPVVTCESLKVTYRYIQYLWKYTVNLHAWAQMHWPYAITRLKLKKHTNISINIYMQSTIWFDIQTCWLIHITLLEVLSWEKHHYWCKKFTWYILNAC